LPFARWYRAHRGDAQGNGEEIKEGKSSDTVCSGNERPQCAHGNHQILRRLGCEEIGFMDSFDQHEVLLAFKHRGRAVQLKASAKGWAQLYLKENPWTYSRRSARVEYEQAALRQGHVAVNSILRDLIKGQMTCGHLHKGNLSPQC
jgi:hypothetical protein